MKSKKQINIYFCLLFFSAFLIRCLFAYNYRGFLSDTACFSGWASRVYSGGFANFYSPDVFSDYPPGYMYILYLLGAISHTLSFGYLSVCWTALQAVRFFYPTGGIHPEEKERGKKL